jgi:EpsI family protein
LFVAYFESQKYGSQIHSPKHCLPGGGWKILNLEPFDLPLAGGDHKHVNRMIIGEGSQREVMFYWYETRGGTVRNEFGLKWDLMVNSLLLRPTDAAIVRFHMPISPGESADDATERVVAHIRTFSEDIDNALPFGRQKT